MKRLLFAALAAAFVFQAEAKPFRKALVIAGGGLSPGVALGMIAGARAAGYEPDVIITTCGASLGASIYSSFGNENQALAFAKSEAFYRQIKGLVKIDSWTPFPLKRKFDKFLAQPNLLPELFDDNIVSIPETVSGILPREKFPSGKTRLIVLAARAAYGPADTGRAIGVAPLIKEVYFTDASTAVSLKGRRSAVKDIFPEARVTEGTQVMTGVGMSQAARASISDPYYINPAKIGDRYYFGGAVDLFPIELATDVADEVLVNFPTGLYSFYEDLAIASVFGFEQSRRASYAAGHTDVKWLDSSGTQEIAMDPVLSGLFFVNKIPSSYEAFRALIDKQFKFGYARAVEAVKIQRSRVNVRKHLRHSAVGIRS